MLIMVCLSMTRIMEEMVDIEDLEGSKGSLVSLMAMEIGLTLTITLITLMVGPEMATTKVVSDLTSKVETGSTTFRIRINNKMALTHKVVIELEMQGPTKAPDHKALVTLDHNKIRINKVINNINFRIHSNRIRINRISNNKISSEIKDKTEANLVAQDQMEEMVTL